MKHDVSQLPWKNLIPIIPIESHAAEITASIWKPHLTAKQHKMIFGGQDSIRISRQRLLRHRYRDKKQKCIEVLMWGYPPGGRGRLREKFLKNLTTIAKLAAEPDDWPAYYSKLHDIGGLGISTITKLSYFFSMSFNGRRSIIIDSKVIAVLASCRWEGLALQGITYDNAHKRYPEYLNICRSLSKQLRCTVDQIEFFLFFMGSAL